MSQIDLSTFSNRKTALVLSGGVVKAAAWHLGVALALNELGFVFKNNENFQGQGVLTNSLEISTYVGSSAGAMICIYLASGYTPKEIINATLGEKSRLKGIGYKEMFHLHKGRAANLRSDKIEQFEDFPYVIRKILKPITSFSGFFSTEGCREYLLKNVLDGKDTFEEYKADLFIVATQLDHSRKVIFSKYNYPNPSHDSTSEYYTGTKISDAIAASMSVPPFYVPYPIKNEQTNQIDYYIDGEIRETLSTHVAEDNLCDCIISSWTHTPYHYHDEIGSLANYGLTSIVIQSIYLLIQKKIVANRAKRATAADIIDTVNDYLKAEKLDDKHRKKITSILEKKLSFKRHIKHIDICPDHHDFKMFFANSFSMNPSTSSYAIERGYTKAIEVLSQL